MRRPSLARKLAQYSTTACADVHGENTLQGLGRRIPVPKVNSILPQFKLGLAMPPEKKVDGSPRERVLSRRFLKAAHVGGSEAAGGKRRGGRGEGAGTASEKGERGGDASEAMRGEGKRRCEARASEDVRRARQGETSRNQPQLPTPTPTPTPVPLRMLASRLH